MADDSAFVVDKTALASRPPMKLTQRGADTLVAAAPSARRTNALARDSDCPRPALGATVPGMFTTPAGPPRYKPTPTDCPELRLHPQRAKAIDATERRLVCPFLERYVPWCARRRDIRPLHGALELLIEVAGTRRLTARL
jgi:hypothetical protein